MDKSRTLLLRNIALPFSRGAPVMLFEPEFTSFPDGETPGGGTFDVKGELPRPQAHAKIGAYVVSPDGHIRFGHRDDTVRLPCFSFEFEKLPMTTGTENVSIPYLLVVHAEYGKDTFREVHRIILVDKHSKH
jgi:hypothetical protein